jgi:hypothetical protein
MKKPACVLIGLLVLLFTAEAVMAATFVQVSTGSRYDRDPEFLKAKDGSYWLFFTRGRTSPGVRGVNSYDPDADNYDIYYKTAKKVSGLTSAAEHLVPGSDAVTVNAQRDIAAVQAADGTIWLFASSGYTASSDPRVFYYQYKKGSGWSGPTGIDNTGTAGHVDAVVVGGIIWVFFDEWPYSLKQMFWNGAGWSTPTTILDKATLGKAVYQAGRFYLVWAYCDSDLGVYGTYIGLASSADGLVWGAVGQVAAWTGATNWDPVLVMFPGEKKFRLYWAPDTGATGQFIALSTSKTPLKASSWSSPKQITTASSGANSWWDFWPNARPTPRYLFFASERNAAGTAMTNSHVWMLRQ